MFKNIVYFFSLFILNKEKRLIFQKKCFNYKRNLDQMELIQNKVGQLDELWAKLAQHDAMLTQQSRFILGQGGVLFGDRKRFLMQTVLEEEHNTEEHQKNEAALYRNLDVEAKQHLDEIIGRKKRCAQKDVISFDELYAEGNDKQQWRALQEFEQQILPCDNFFTYKHYKLPIDCFEPEVFLYKHGIDRLKTFNAMGSKAILDVGCFVGDTILILRELTDNDIYSFEPAPVNHSHALRTLELNKPLLAKGGKVVLENIALGDTNGSNKILAPLYNGSYIGAAAMLIGENAEAGSPVSVRTLDSYVAEHNLQVGMIKVDIEGFEQRFLAGAMETIKSQKPILLLSIYHNQQDFYHIKPMIENLDLGYKFDFFQGVNRWVVNDVMLVCEVY